MNDATARTLLFDLDGTLTDPFEGITRSIQYAIEKMGRIAPAADALRWCIGPPLQISFRELLATEDEERVAHAVALYRERYSDVGKFENVLIEGIPEALAELSAQGYRMAIATSKLQSYAKEIVAHFGLADNFDSVYGAEPDGRLSDKGELIDFVLKIRHIDAARTCMVGDRMHDIVGARKNGVGSIGVLWGYGDKAELSEAGADQLVSKPADLAAAVAKICP